MEHGSKSAYTITGKDLVALMVQASPLLMDKYKTPTNEIEHSQYLFASYHSFMRALKIFCLFGIAAALGFVIGLLRPRRQPGRVQKQVQQ